jgi:hypothetical protein
MEIESLRKCRRVTALAKKMVNMSFSLAAGFQKARSRSSVLLDL